MAKALIRNIALGSTPTSTVKPHKTPFAMSVTWKILDGILQGVGFVLRYVANVFWVSIWLSRYPLALLFSIWLLVNIGGHMLKGVLTPICYLPGFYGSRFCAGQALTSATMAGPPQWADYPTLMDAQTTMLESLLSESASGSALSWEIKKAELATTDLVTLVHISDLTSRDLLSKSLSEFIKDARKTGRDLQKLHSRIGGIVDNIMAINDYALREIEAAHTKSRSFLSHYGLIPWSIHDPTQAVLIRTFGKAMGVVSASLQHLVIEAEINLNNLEKLEEHLLILHEMIEHEDLRISSAKLDLLAGLWTKLGGNKAKLHGYNSNLILLKNLSLYRRKALAHVVAILQSLATMSSNMEDMQGWVATPELAGSKIPIEVYVMSIQSGIDRLQEGRALARRCEEGTMRRALGIAGGEKETETLIL